MKLNDGIESCARASIEAHFFHILIRWRYATDKYFFYSYKNNVRNQHYEKKENFEACIDLSAWFFLLPWLFGNFAAYNISLCHILLSIADLFVCFFLVCVLSCPQTNFIYRRNDMAFVEFDMGELIVVHAKKKKICLQHSSPFPH